MAQKAKPKRGRGRPPKPTEKRLMSYGLHLMPDKLGKLRAIRRAKSATVRDYLEGRIEKDYQELVRLGIVTPDAWKALVTSDEPEEGEAVACG